METWGPITTLDTDICTLDAQLLRHEYIFGLA